MLEIEQIIGERVLRTKIMEPFVRPAANLAEHQTTLSVGPNSAVLPGETPGYYLPLLNGSLPEGAKSFNLSGFAVNSMDAASGPAIFDTLSQTATDALETLNSATGSSETELPTLSGLILTVTATAPGRDPAVEERRIVDLETGHQRLSGDPISIQAVIDVGVGQENGARKALEGIAASQAALELLPYRVALINQELSFRQAADDFAAVVGRGIQTLDPYLRLIKIYKEDQLYLAALIGNDRILTHLPESAAEANWDKGQIYELMDDKLNATFWRRRVRPN